MVVTPDYCVKWPKSPRGFWARRLQEPLPDDSPLWAVQNLHLTPHNSGNPDGAVPGGDTPRYNAAVAEIFCAQLRRYLAGEAVFNGIDNALGY